MTPPRPPKAPLDGTAAAFVPAPSPSPLHSRFGSATHVAVAAMSVNIAELRRKTVPELQELANGYSIEDSAGLPKQELVFKIEQKMLDSSVALTCEGVLEILPEGYGFLRSHAWNYLHGPDDIYVSPSQIKRFDLKTGDTIS